MPAPLKITLSESEDLTLRELSIANNIPRRTKSRAIAVRLNNQGWSVAQISLHLGWANQTVRVAISRWKKSGLRGLWDLPRSGRQRKWSEEDWQLMEKWLRESRGYTSKQLAKKWSVERDVKLGSEQIRRILKKKLAMEENKKKTAI